MTTSKAMGKTSGTATGTATPQEVLRFWLDEVGPEGWYSGGADLDRAITDRFRSTWDAAMSGGLGLWLTYPSGVLAYLIVTDQMSRNMFRGTANAYASDHLARAAAHKAINLGWDMKIDEPARQFFYMPLEHSESLSDQDHAVRLVSMRMPGDTNGLLLHARAHREIIRKFGRFPFRNDHLGRSSTRAELDFVSGGGYGAVIQALKAA